MKQKLIKLIKQQTHNKNKQNLRKYTQNLKKKTKELKMNKA